MRQHASLKDPDAFSTTALGKLETQAALADAGFPDDTDNATISLYRAFEFRRERGGLVASTGEGA
jgi:hypothetical protein